MRKFQTLKINLLKTLYYTQFYEYLITLRQEIKNEYY